MVPLHFLANRSERREKPQQLLSLLPHFMTNVTQYVFSVGLNAYCFLRNLFKMKVIRRQWVSDFAGVKELDTCWEVGERKFTHFGNEITVLERTRNEGDWARKLSEFSILKDSMFFCKQRLFKYPRYYGSSNIGRLDRLASSSIVFMAENILRKITSPNKVSLLSSFEKAVISKIINFAYIFFLLCITQVACIFFPLTSCFLAFTRHTIY